MKPADFLMRVWKLNCSDGDFVFLSTKSKSNQWKDHSFTWSRGIKKEIQSFLEKFPPSKFDVYFCPLAFSKDRRLSKYVKPTSLLWSDVDEVPYSKIKETSRIIWESSPGRFQALWLLDKTLDPDQAEHLNQKLTYYLEADKGGWDLTQVLRIPGTPNHKYPAKPVVKIRIFEDKRTRVRTLYRITQGIDTNAKKESDIEIEESQVSSLKLFEKYRARIPPKVRRLLYDKNPEIGKRSDIIWYLENKLYEAGMTPGEILTVIKHSPWNKYSGRADEDKRLASEISKIIKDNPQVKEQAAEESLSTGLLIESFGEVMGNLQAYPGWLVESIWMKKSHGIVAGEPKSFKSTLAIDLAISVASGKPFLGEFPVHQQGPVIYIQNENSAWIMKDRLEKITSSKSIVGKITRRKTGRKFRIKFPTEIPLYSINQQNFLLTDPVHQQIIEQIILEIKPQLVIFDPLYLMFDGELSSAKELNPVLSWLLNLKNEYDTGVMVVHHWKKGANGDSSRGGQRMLGSTTLHGWIESAWYIATNTIDGEEEELNQQKESTEVVIEREFRGAGQHPKALVNLSMGGFGDPKYKTKVSVYKPTVKTRRGSSVDNSSLVDEVLSQLRTTRNAVTIYWLAQRIGSSRTVIRRVIDGLISDKAVTESGKNKFKLTQE